MMLENLFESVLIELFFFFFQAEDGIRDIGVTGVQTCALPIWRRRTCPGPYPGRIPGGSTRHGGRVGQTSRAGQPNMRGGSTGRGGRVDRLAARSGERRVGEECRFRWWPCN